jgi:branched-chain amino acid transport system permease protein/neutral amino acid transport system permease protein
MDLPFVLVSSILTAAIWCLPAAALSLVYSVLRYPNFAIPEYMTLGAYLTFLFSHGMPMSLAVLLGCLATGIIAAALDQLFFRPVRSQGGQPAILLSLGLMMVLQNTVRFFWGNEPRQYDVPLQEPVRFGGFVMTIDQIEAVAAVAVGLLALWLLLRFSAFGRATRSISDNPELAQVTGIRLERTYVGVMILSGAMAALGGVILAAETTLLPLLGWRSMVPLFAVAIFGGLGSITGAALAALILAFVSEASLGTVPATYKVALAFVVMALVLTVRPTGLVRPRGSI